MTTTQASAIVTRCGEDVTEECSASAFNWVRDSGDVEADNAWNAAHAGMKSISLTTADLGGDPNGDVKLTCTLTCLRCLLRQCQWSFLISFFLSGDLLIRVWIAGTVLRKRSCIPVH